MTHDEMIAVITHHKNGGKVQHTGKNYNLRWNDLPDGQEPTWDFSCVNYRIKPEPTVVYVEFNDHGKPMTTELKPFVSPFKRPVRKFVEVME